MAKVRLDDLLVELGYFANRGEALRSVIAHEVRVDDVYATSAAIKVKSDCDLYVKGRKRYVSRGGFKLQGALDHFGQDCTGLKCIDVGSSTGGFTDCMLQAGAASVAAVDVNYGQLDMSLRRDPRVTEFERTNIRLADPEKLGAPFDLIVCDLSFIGIAGLAEVFASLGKTGSVFIGLIKPQFESQHEETDRGVVTSQEVRERVVAEVVDALSEAGFVVDGVVESSITGRKRGNTEYLVRAVLA